MGLFFGDFFQIIYHLMAVIYEGGLMAFIKLFESPYIKASFYEVLVSKKFLTASYLELAAVGKKLMYDTHIFKICHLCQIAGSET